MADASTKARSFAALHHPAYRRYFITSALAMMADGIEHVISYFIVFQKFQSPILGGIAILTHWLPFLLFSVYFGALADRFDVRRLMQLGMILFMIASAGWGVLFFNDSLEMWHAVVLLTIHGLAGVLWVPAGQLLVHELVSQNDLQSAVRLTSTSRQLGLIAAPAIGGALMLTLGPGLGILVNVVFYVPLLIWLQLHPRAVRQTKAAVRTATDIAGDIAAALRDVARDPVILSMTILAAGTSLLVGNAYHAQMPEFAHDLGHGKGDWYYSLLLTAEAVGALTAGIVLESRGLLRAQPRTAIVLAILWSLAILAFAAVKSYPVAVALLALAGFLNLAFSAMAQTLVQIHTPAAVRGRVIGLYNMGTLGLRAASGVTVGVLGGMIGIHWSRAGSALALCVATIVLLAFTPRATL